MSRATQIEFARLVDSYYQQHQSALRLASPSFNNDGFVSRATMSGSGGIVEILCGPAEYHAEIFITTLKDHKRWNLADLMSVGTLKQWLVSYSQRASSQGKSGLEADIEWIFLILTEGLRGAANFEWLGS
jgi:hypothetical protein